MNSIRLSLRDIRYLVCTPFCTSSPKMEDAASYPPLPFVLGSLVKCSLADVLSMEKYIICILYHKRKRQNKYLLHIYEML